MNPNQKTKGESVPPHPTSMKARSCVVTAADEQEFLEAMQAYKKRSGRMFPTWSEIFEVLRSLGYEKRIWQPIAVPRAKDPLALPQYAPEGLDAPMLLWFGQVETASFP